MVKLSYSIVVALLGEALAKHKGTKVKYTKAKAAKSFITTVPIDQTPISYSCLDGFYLDGDMCTRQMTSPLLPVCYEGSLIGNQCALYAPFEFDCPEYTTRFGEMCMATSYADFLVICPPEYERSSGVQSADCFRELPQPSLWICPPGTVETEAGCALYTELAPESICPDGYQLQVDGICMMIRSYPCPIAVGKGKHHGAKHRHLGKKVKYAKKGHVHLPPPIPEPVITTEIVSQECRDTLTIVPQLKCPPAYYLERGICIAVSYLDRLEQPVDPRMDIIPANIGCPFGYEMCAAGGQCCQETQSQASRFCPVGYVEEAANCVLYGPVEYECGPMYTREGGLCVAYETIPPIGQYTVTYQCEGFDCGVSAHHKSNGKGHHGKGH